MLANSPAMLKVVVQEFTSIIHLRFKKDPKKE